MISNEQGAQIAGLQSAIDNTNQAVSLVQTGEGALSTVNNLLVQIRGLALSAANSAVNDPTALAADQAQIQNALQTIDNISQNTQFGTKKLLDGSAAAQVDHQHTGGANVASSPPAPTPSPGSYSSRSRSSRSEGAAARHRLHRCHQLRDVTDRRTAISGTATDTDTAPTPARTTSSSHSRVQGGTSPRDRGGRPGQQHRGW